MVINHELQSPIALWPDASIRSLSTRHFERASLHCVKSNRLSIQPTKPGRARFSSLHKTHAYSTPRTQIAITVTASATDRITRKKKKGGEKTEATNVAMCLALPTYAFPSSRKTKLTKLHSLACKSTLLRPPSRGRKHFLLHSLLLHHHSLL